MADWGLSNFSRRRGIELKTKSRREKFRSSRPKIKIIELERFRTVALPFLWKSLSSAGGFKSCDNFIILEQVDLIALGEKEAGKSWWELKVFLSQIMTPVTPRTDFISSNMFCIKLS